MNHELYKERKKLKKSRYIIDKVNEFKRKLLNLEIGDSLEFVMDSLGSSDFYSGKYSDKKISIYRWMNNNSISKNLSNLDERSFKVDIYIDNSTNKVIKISSTGI